MLATTGAHTIILPADRTMCWVERSKSANRERPSSISRERWASSVSRERSTTSRPPSQLSSSYLPRPASAGSLCSQPSQHIGTDSSCRRADTPEMAMSDDDVNSSIKRRHQGPWPVHVERKCAIVRQQQRAGRDGIIKIPHLLGFKLDQLRLEDSWCLVVETCHQCETHVQFMRHDPEQYKNALQVLTLAANQCEHTKLACVQLPTPDLGQRMGACEVFLLPPRILETCSAPAYLLHSKLLTKTWPNARGLCYRMEQEIPALDVAWSSMVMKTQDARASLEWRLQTAEKTINQLQEQLLVKATLEEELQFAKQAAQTLESHLAAAEFEKARREGDLSRLEALEKQLKMAQEESFKAVDQNSELTLALKNAIDVQQNLQLQLQAMEEQHSTLQANLLEAKAAQADKANLEQSLQATKEALRASEMDAKERATQVDEEKAEHASRAAQLDDMVLALTDSVKSATASSEKWMDEFSAERKEKHSLESQISEMKAEKEKADEELRTKNKELARTKDALEKLRLDVTAATDDNYDLRRQLKDVEEAADEKIVELNEQLHDERDKAEEEREKSTEALAESKDKIYKLKVQLKSTEEIGQRALAKYEADQKELRSQLTAATEESKLLQDELALCKAAQDSLQEELEAAHGKLLKVSAEHEDLQKAKEAKEAELEGLKDEVRKNQELAERSRQLEEELEDVRAELVRASSKVTDSREGSHEEVWDNPELQHRCQQLEKEKAELKSKLSTTHDEKAALEAKLTETLKQKEKMQWDMLQASDDKAELEEELEAVKEDFAAYKEKHERKFWEENSTGTKTSAGLKRIYFDFDQTISKIHTFKQLAGWEAGVAAPHSQSERGQIHRIRLLNAAGNSYVYSASSNLVVASPAEIDGGDDSWTCGVLGGHERIQDLGDLFSALTAAGIKLTIIHEGNVGPCKYMLDNEGLLGFFEQVYGMVGESHGESEFDQAHQETSTYEGTAQNALRESKADLIRRQMASEGLTHNAVLLVDDDPDEINSVTSLCRSLLVSDRKGLTGQQLDEIGRIAGIGVHAETEKEAAEQAVVDAKAVEKTVEKIVEVIKYVDRIIEVPVEVIREVERIKEVPVEVIREVEKLVEVPTEVIREVEKIKEVPVEVIREELDAAAQLPASLPAVGGTEVWHAPEFGSSVLAPLENKLGRLVSFKEEDEESEESTSEEEECKEQTSLKMIEVAGSEVAPSSVTKPPPPPKKAHPGPPGLPPSAPPPAKQMSPGFNPKLHALSDSKGHLLPAAPAQLHTKPGSTPGPPISQTPQQRKPPPPPKQSALPGSEPVPPLPPAPKQPIATLSSPAPLLDHQQRPQVSFGDENLQKQLFCDFHYSQGR
eukprot:TRINITY_DN675_c1_g2_i2.p1 TRINITY_DN675_c1_g2~~TRINITY_DN675_c1_g2_i2.p1  ORF type:complete len:1350 (-),score=330.26 TRINITY_DN675_c1_g2_i2:317-4366(-)